VSALLTATNLRKEYRHGNSPVTAVDGIDLRVDPAEVVGLVGESGSGKSTVGRMLLRLTAPTSGRITYRGNDITRLGPRELEPYRRSMQIVFQDPYASLNRRMTVRQILAEPLEVHGMPRADRSSRVDELLRIVGLPLEAKLRYPHEFSGGQRQRIGIARAIAVEPEFIVADEAVSALDVSVQAQILNLLADLRESLGLAILFIAHDLGVVRHIADRVMVMYLGRIVEEGPVAELFAHPVHPYTQALLSAVPVPDPEVERTRMVLGGDMPSPLDAPSGCVFRTRCPIAQDVCAESRPPLVGVGTRDWRSESGSEMGGQPRVADHRKACFLRA
jgi:peptide/nickel transport system ATP-binding protein